MSEQKLTNTFETSSDVTEIGDALRAARKTFGLTQADVAKIMESNAKFIGRLERGGSNPTLQTIIKYSEALGLTVHFSFNNRDQDTGAELTNQFQASAQKLGRELANTRKASGLTQADIAETMNSNAKFIGRLERGGTNPTVQTLKKYADSLNIDIRVSFTADESTPI